MKSAHSRKGEFRNVGENLCRYSSNGVYYARFRINGKLIHRSLNTTDREFAERLLKEEISKAGRIDQKLATTPLSELFRLYPFPEVQRYRRGLRRPNRVYGVGRSGDGRMRQSERRAH